MFKNTAERLLFKSAQQRIFMQFLIEKWNRKTMSCSWLRVIVSCINDASGKVLPRVLTFYREINKKQPVIFNTIECRRTPSYFLLWNFFKPFISIITALSPHFLSPLQSSMFQRCSLVLFSFSFTAKRCAGDKVVRDEVEMLLDIR